MQEMGVYNSDHVPEVSNADGIDTFQVRNYTCSDLALTLTFLLLGLVDNGTLKMPIVPRDRAAKTLRPKHDKDKIEKAKQLRDTCLTTMVSTHDIRKEVPLSILYCIN